MEGVFLRLILISIGRSWLKVSGIRGNARHSQVVSVGSEIASYYSKCIYIVSVAGYYSKCIVSVVGNYSKCIMSVVCYYSRCI